MKKVLLLGANGLLGSSLRESLRLETDVKLLTAARKGNVDYHFAYSFFALRQLLAKTQPDIIINCIADTSKTTSMLRMIHTNSLLPINLAILALYQKFHVVHFSTDAVFSGRKTRNYERSFTLPLSKYGTSKLLGDISSFRCLILRTSFVGISPDRSIKKGVAHKLLHLEKGATFEILEDRAWNGVTSNSICEIINLLIAKNTFFHGVFHVTSSRSTTYSDLITKLIKKLNREDIKVSIKYSGRLKNFALDSRKQHFVKSIWVNTSYETVPDLETLISRMKW